MQTIQQEILETCLSLLEVFYSDHERWKALVGPRGLTDSSRDPNYPLIYYAILYFPLHARTFDQRQWEELFERAFLASKISEGGPDVAPETETEDLRAVRAFWSRAWEEFQEIERMSLRESWESPAFYLGCHYEGLRKFLERLLTLQSEHGFPTSRKLRLVG